ncbi:hypothetical protein ACF0H5_018907 [Mactra antiquata]
MREPSELNQAMIEPQNTMRSVLQPTFMIDPQYEYLLQRIDLFKELTVKFMDKIKQGKNPALKILTLITESVPVQGVEPLEHLFLLLKQASFDISGLEITGSYNKHDTNNDEKQTSTTTHSGNRWHSFLGLDQTQTKLRRLSEEYSKVIEEHKQLCLSYRVIRKKIRPFVIGNVCPPLFVETDEEGNDISDGDQLRSTTDKQYIRSNLPELSKTCKGDIWGLMTLTRDSWVTSHRERKLLREKLLPLESKLYEMGYERIFSKLQDGVKSLLQGCKFAGLKTDLVDELEGINCKNLTHQLIQAMSVKYYYPALQTIQDSLDIPVAYVLSPDIKEFRKPYVYRGYKQFNLYGSRDNLLDFDAISDFPRENVYVTATQKVSVKKQCGYFSMKKG